MRAVSIRSAIIERSQDCHCRLEEQGRKRTVAFKFDLKMITDQIYDLEEDEALGSDGSALGTAT